MRCDQLDLAIDIISQESLLFDVTAMNCTDYDAADTWIRHEFTASCFVCSVRPRGLIEVMRSVLHLQYPA